MKRFIALLLIGSMMALTALVISESYDGEILDAQIEMYLEDVKRVHKE